MEVGLLHGFGASAFTWRNLVGELESVHRTVILDRPWASAGEQVSATVDELDRHGLDRAVLVGHSAGAEIAIKTAATHPQRVRALVLIGPVVTRGAPYGVRVLASIPGSGLIAPGLLRAGSRLIGPALRSTYHDRALVTADVVRGYREPLLVPGVMEALWAMSRERTEPSDTVVADIRQPHLVITGDNDRWTNLPATDAGVHVEIARCGHLPHEEKPRQTATAILEFLDHLPD